MEKYKHKKYLSLQEHKEIGKTNNIKTQREWLDYIINNNINNLHHHPITAFKHQEKMSWGTFLGTNKIANQKRNFLSKEEAIKFIHPLKIKGKKEWDIYCKSGNKPLNIPTDLSRTYKCSLTEMLGNDNIATTKRVYYSLDELKKIIHPLKFNSISEYEQWYKNINTDKKIPARPSVVYIDKGWKDWPDFLNNNNTFTHIVSKQNKKKIHDFINILRKQIKTLDIVELVKIIQQAEGGYFYDELRNNTNFRRIIAGDQSDEAIETLLGDFDNTNNIAPTLPDQIEPEENIIVLPEPELTLDRSVLGDTASSIDQIETLGEYVMSTSMDEETVEFMHKRRVNSLFNELMNRTLDLNKIMGRHGNEFFESVKNDFFEEYNHVNSWNWKKEIKGDKYKFPHEPNLMQRLFCSRVLKYRRYNNFSGTGAGKTLSAIMATKITNSRNVLIITFDSTVHNWERDINNSFSNNNVIKKERDPKFLKNKTNYLILNYEFFQQAHSEETTHDIIGKHTFDFVILDEVHMTKQRDENLSKRREIILKMLHAIEDVNPDLYIVGMSATPVINNLTEAKALLEMTTLRNYDELDTTNTVNNAMNIYTHLILNGIRYKPKYEISIKDVRPQIEGSHLIDRLRILPKNRILDIERVLIDDKLRAVKDNIRKGTIIYTYYVDGLVEPIQNYARSLGLTVGLYTGDDKTGYELFINGKVDVLIGSKPIGTGVDRLQHVSNNLVIMSLPWTHAEYEQLIGRIWRQGSKFKSIEVVIPQVYIEMEDYVWSWDKYRMDRIEHKKTLGDCAMDGIIPSEKIATPQTMLKRAIESLDVWVERLNSQDDVMIERPKKSKKLRV